MDTRMKLLIVEDEPRIGQYLRQGLSEAGFAVDLTADGDEGLQLALAGEHDLLILDVMLPGRDGWQILRRRCARPAARCRCCSSPPATPWRTACAAWNWAPTITW